VFVLISKKTKNTTSVCWHIKKPLAILPNSPQDVKIFNPITIRQSRD